jgi:hypothetical protein
VQRRWSGAGLRTGGAIAGWMVVVGFGLRALAQFSNTPGPAGQPPAIWPDHAPIALATDRSTLLVFAHPQCACSRATIGELARIVARCSDRVAPAVFVYQPADPPEDWPVSSIWKAASEIPGVRVAHDPDGAIARLFRAETSGETLLYNADGRLQFGGGITASRGQAGDNYGRDAIVSLLLNREPGRRQTPAFGCALFAEQR